jgi:phenylacetate-coenzyme A ligase PaaK-like adenylate-forming protein
MQEHPYTTELFNSNPFTADESVKKLFINSYRECAQHHYHHSALIKKFWQDANIHPDEIRTEQDLKRTPPIMVNLYKEHDFKSVPDQEIVLTLTSSGTGRLKTKQHLNLESLQNVKKSAFQIHSFLGMANDQEEYQYLCFSYDPNIAKDLGTAFTDELLTHFTRKKDVFYAIQWNEQKRDFEFNLAGTIETLKRYEKSGFPTRILGFPSFLLDLVETHQLKLNLGNKSWIQTGGGWKNAKNQEVPKGVFREKMSQALGIPIEHIRDLFGMVEHGIPYVDCELGNLHIPNYSRVYIRSPHNLNFLKNGEVGLIQFLCSYNFSYPALNILTTDYGSIEACSCRLGGETLKLHGRAGLNQHKGCAIKALDLLKKTR